jgi:flavin reductase (DIM6/NTAB) family NADH-FMN oxidoreductase RutF
MLLSNQTQSLDCSDSYDRERLTILSCYAFCFIWFESRNRSAEDVGEGHISASTPQRRHIMHLVSEPAILYFGAPVALLSTLNDDGTPNLSPMSSTLFVSWRGVLGLQGNSKTVENLRRTGEMVINFPSVAQVGAVNRIARTTGTFPVPDDKVARGFRYEKDKFAVAGLTPVKSELVEPPRVLECPIQLEARLVTERPLDQGGPLEGFLTTFEMRIHKIHVEQAIIMAGHPNRIDPDKWRPLLFSFQQFYGLGGQVTESRMAEINEELYRTPDMQKASAAA